MEKKTKSIEERVKILSEHMNIPIVALDAGSTLNLSETEFPPIRPCSMLTTYNARVSPWALSDPALKQLTVSDFTIFPRPSAP